MDISQTTVPDSTQVNAEDFLGGPCTVTVAGVRQGTSEQPVNIDLVEFPGRAYRPSKTMRRVIVAAWGPDSDVYVGRRLTLYRDPEVTFGRDKPGGIKISHLSHIARPMTLALTVTRGRRAPHVVEPLTDAAPPPTSHGDETPDPLKEVGRLMKLANITEREHAAAYVTDVVGREVASTKELTAAEVDTLVVSLKREVGEA